jgi:hypothetical protein
LSLTTISVSAFHFGYFRPHNGRWSRYCGAGDWGPMKREKLLLAFAIVITIALGMLDFFVRHRGA